MAKTATKNENTVAEKLNALYELQLIDSEIDRIRTIRGELPLEVQDLEEEVAGLDPRVEKMQEEIKSLAIIANSNLLQKRLNFKSSKSD